MRHALIKKYEVLYKSGIDMVVFLNFSKKNHFKGCSNEQIEEWSKENQLEYPPSVWAYLKTFGVFSNIEDNEYNIGSHYSSFSQTKEFILMRPDKRNKMTIKEYIIKNDFRVNYDELYDKDKQVGIYTPRLSEIIDLSKINIFLVELNNEIYHFYDSSHENPEVFYYIDGKGVTSNYTTVTNTYRKSIFQFICKYAPYAYENLSEITKDTPFKPFTLDCPEEKLWLKKYTEMLQNIDFRKFSRMNDYRNLFYLLNDKREKEEDRILSLDEFETDFIKFLSKN